MNRARRGSFTGGAARNNDAHHIGPATAAHNRLLRSSSPSTTGTSSSARNASQSRPSSTPYIGTSRPASSRSPSLRSNISNTGTSSPSTNSSRSVRPSNTKAGAPKPASGKSLSLTRRLRSGISQSGGANSQSLLRAVVDPNSPFAAQNRGSDIDVSKTQVKPITNNLTLDDVFKRNNLETPTKPNDRTTTPKPDSRTVSSESKADDRATPSKPKASAKPTKPRVTGKSWMAAADYPGLRQSRRHQERNEEEQGEEEQCEVERVVIVDPQPTTPLAEQGAPRLEEQIRHVLKHGQEAYDLTPGRTEVRWQRYLDELDDARDAFNCGAGTLYERYSRGRAKMLASEKTASLNEYEVERLVTSVDDSVARKYARNPNNPTNNVGVASAAGQEASGTFETPKRGRGRPRKYPYQPSADEEEARKGVKEFEAYWQLYRPEYKDRHDMRGLQTQLVRLVHEGTVFNVDVPTALDPSQPYMGHRYGEHIFQYDRTKIWNLIRGDIDEVLIYCGHVPIPNELHIEHFKSTLFPAIIKMIVAVLAFDPNTPRTFVQMLEAVKLGAGTQPATSVLEWLARVYHANPSTLVNESTTALKTAWKIKFGDIQRLPVFVQDQVKRPETKAAICEAAVLVKLFRAHKIELESGWDQIEWFLMQLTEESELSNFSYGLMLHQEGLKALRDGRGEVPHRHDTERVLVFDKGPASDAKEYIHNLYVYRFPAPGPFNKERLEELRAAAYKVLGPEQSRKAIDLARQEQNEEALPEDWELPTPAKRAYNKRSLTNTPTSTTPKGDTAVAAGEDAFITPTKDSKKAVQGKQTSSGKVSTGRKRGRPRKDEQRPGLSTKKVKKTTTHTAPEPTPTRRSPFSFRVQLSSPLYSEKDSQGSQQDPEHGSDQDWELDE